MSLGIHHTQLMAFSRSTHSVLCVCVHVRVCEVGGRIVRVREREERERKRERESVCVCEREGEKERERVRESERECVYVCV